MKKKIFTLISLACATLGAFAQSGTAERFYVGVTGYNGSSVAATASFTVYDDFHCVGILPGKDVVLDASKAKLDVRMTDVPTLGVSGVKSYTHTFETSTEVKSTLGEWIPSAYAFKGCTVPVSVIDNKGIDSFVYNVSATSADNQVTITPDSYDNAHAAWIRLTNHVTTGSSSADSKVLVKSGSYVQIGTEKIVVNSDATFLEGNWSISSEVSNARSISTITTGAASGADSFKAIAFLPAGSTVYLGGMYATLNDDCTITVDASAAYNSSDFTLGMKALADATTNKEREEILLNMLEDCINIAGNAGNIPVVVDFTSPEPILTVYPGNENAMENQTVAQFIQTRETTPNAVAYTTSDHAAEVAGVENVVIEYTVGAAGNKYYESEKFVLVDAKNFYTPKDFIALAGGYSRVSNAAKYTTEGGEPNYNSFCLPFAFEASEFSSSASILTFSFYEEKDGHRNAYFNEKTSIEAGVPCVLADAAKTWNDIVFNNTEIVSYTVKANNMQGTYVETTEFGGGKFYSVVGEENKFGPLASILGPFRSCLSLEEGIIIPTNAKDQYINVVVIDPTAINEVNTDASENGPCFTIAGQIANGKNLVPGIYVKNGKKFIVK